MGTHISPFVKSPSTQIPFFNSPPTITRHHAAHQPHRPPRSCPCSRSKLGLWCRIWCLFSPLLCHLRSWICHLDSQCRQLLRLQRRCLSCFVRVQLHRLDHLRSFQLRRCRVCLSPVRSRICCKQLQFRRVRLLSQPFQSQLRCCEQRHWCCILPRFLDLGCKLDPG